MKNFRVYYQINGQEYTEDFSMDGVISAETKSISAWLRIKKAHPDVRREDTAIGDIVDITVR